MPSLRRIVVGLPLLAGAAFAVALLLTPTMSAGARIPATTFRLVNPSFTLDPVIIINPCIVNPASCASTTASTTTTAAPDPTTTAATTTTTTTTTTTAVPRSQTDRLNRTGATIVAEDEAEADITADDGGLPIAVPIAAGVVLAAGAVAAVLVVRSRRA